MATAGGTPSNNLYVTDLPAGLDDESLRQIFELYGTVVSVKVLSKGGDKCHALVRFQNQQEAEWIVENLDGNMPQGLDEPVGVRFADPPKAGFAAGAAAGPYGMAQKGAMGGIMAGKGCGGMAKGCGKGMMAMGGGGESIDTLIQTLTAAKALPSPPQIHALYIQGLPQDTLNNDLLRLFSPFGAIPPDGVRSMLNPDGSCKGIGFVNFTDEVVAETACLTLNGTMMPWGKQLLVKKKDDSGKGGGGAPGAKGGAFAGGQKSNYKSKLCTLFAEGRCTRQTCSFAHGEEELQALGAMAP